MFVAFVLSEWINYIYYSKKGIGAPRAWYMKYMGYVL